METDTQKIRRWGDSLFRNTEWDSYWIDAVLYKENQKKWIWALEVRGEGITFLKFCFWKLEEEVAYEIQEIKKAHQSCVARGGMPSEFVFQ